MRNISLFLFLSVFSIHIAFAQDSLQKIIPNKILFKKQDKHNYSISPNGKYFIEVIETNKESDLFVVDIDNYKLLHKIPFGTKDIDQVYWLTNDRLLYESFGAIYAIDIDGSNSMRIVGRYSDKAAKNWRSHFGSLQYNKLINLMHGKEHQVLIETFDTSSYASIKEVNVFTGEKYTVMNGAKYKIDEWITDPYGNVRFGLRYEDNGLSYYKYDKETDKLSPMSIIIDGITYRLKVDPKSYLSQNITFETFDFDPQIIYITSNVGTDKRKLLKYNIVTDKVIEVVAEDVNCDVKDVDGREISFVYDYAEGKLAGIQYTAITPQQTWFLEKYANIQQVLKTNYPKYIHSIIDSDSNSEKFLIFQWNDENAGNIGVFDTKDDSYAVMFHFNHELNEFKLSKTKNIVAKARDGYNLPCYFTLPPDAKKEESLPLVVIPHGGPWSRDYWGLDEYVQYFSNRGYATLRVNYRGSTGFGKKHVMAGINGIDEIMINDIADATKHIIDKYQIDPSKVFIYGHSYGGYATYMGLLKYPNIYAAGVAVSAPSDIKEWLKDQRRRKHRFAVEFWNTVLGSKKSKYLSKISPITYAEELDKPLLIFHGKMDRTIPVAQAHMMEKALKKEKKDVKLEVLQNEGHSILDGNTLGYVLDKSVKFFKKNGN